MYERRRKRCGSTAQLARIGLTTSSPTAESYPISVEPTREHAEMLLGRIEFIREKLIPLV